MTVKDLLAELANYAEDAEVIVVDWENGMEYTPTIGSDDENEGHKYCRIGIE